MIAVVATIGLSGSSLGSIDWHGAQLYFSFSRFFLTALSSSLCAFDRFFITPYKTVITEKDFEYSLGDYNVQAVIALGIVGGAGISGEEFNWLILV